MTNNVIVDLDGLLINAMERNASDVHFQESGIPMVRIGIELNQLESNAISKIDITNWLASHHCHFIEDGSSQVDTSLSFALAPQIRCRAHIFSEYRGIHVAVRILYPLHTIGTDNDADMLHKLSKLADGLILVCGPTGSGKTTTLWQMIDYLNQHKKCHIITLEDPIEYILNGNQALISQRELNVHFMSFQDGVRQALRQDPDVILIGEMRDEETMDAALTAAETGHLVLSTMHTRSAAQSITRLVGSFPAAKQEEIRMRLAQVLQAVLSQRKYGIAGNSVRIVREVLIHTSAVEQLIRTGKEHQLLSVMQTGAACGMRTMKQAMDHEGLIEI